MKILVYLEKSDVRGGIEIFAERHVARLRAEGHEVDVASDIRQEMGRYDEIVVHKCSDVATLEGFRPRRLCTTFTTTSRSARGHTPTRR